MIDGRFDQHFMEIFAGRAEGPPGSTTGPLLLAAVLIGLALLACFAVLP